MTRGGPATASVTVVATTTCRFFFCQSGGAVRRPSARKSCLEMNSPAACVPFAASPAAAIRTCPVVEFSSLVTTPKSSVTSFCGPKCTDQTLREGPLFFDPHAFIVLREHEAQVGSLLQRPPVIEGSHQDGGSQPGVRCGRVTNATPRDNTALAFSVPRSP